MTIIQQINILLASFSALLGIVAFIFLYRGSHRFYPSRSHTYNLLKFGFFSFLVGHLYSLFVILYAQANQLGKLKTVYLITIGVILMIVGITYLFVSQKKLATGQQDPDIINALKRIRFGQYFLLVPFLCITIHLLFNTPVIVWLLASLIGFTFIIIGTYQLREVKLLGLAETIIVFNLIAFISFIFVLNSYSSNNLKKRFVDIEIDNLTASVDNHINQYLNKDVINRYTEEVNQTNLKRFADELTTEKVKNVIIWDLEGRVIYSDQQDLIGFSSLNFDNDYIQARKGDTVYQLFDQNTDNIYSGLTSYELKFYYPIKLGEAETPAGVIALFVDSSAASQSAWLSRIMLWTLVVGFLTFFVIMLVIDLTILRNTIIRPLQRISNQARNIVEHSDYREHTVIEYESEDEIGQIAKAINKINYRLHNLEKGKEEKEDDKS